MREVDQIIDSLKNLPDDFYILKMRRLREFMIKHKRMNGIALTRLRFEILKMAMIWWERLCYDTSIDHLHESEDPHRQQPTHSHIVEIKNKQMISLEPAIISFRLIVDICELNSAFLTLGHAKELIHYMKRLGFVDAGNALREWFIKGHRQWEKKIPKIDSK